MRPILNRAALGAGLLAFATLLPAAAPRYTVVDFGPNTQGVDLNAAGEVVYVHVATTQAFRFAKGESVSLTCVGEGGFLPLAMNDRGEILGRGTHREKDAAGRPVAHFFLWTQGELREVTAVGLPESVRLGEVVGLDNEGVVAALTNEHPARLCFVREGRVSALFDVAAPVGKHEFTVVERTRGDAAGVVVGSVTGSHWEKKPSYTAQARDAWRGFMATERGVTDLDDFIPRAASASGRLIGQRLQPGEANASVRPKGGPAWRDGIVVREFDGPPGFAEGCFSAISPGGQIVGEGGTVTGGGFLWTGEERHAFLFSDGAWLDLNDLVAIEDGKKLKVFCAVRINDRGQILCQAMGEGGFHAVLLIPVEPTPVPAH